jgi:hypothetical protein
MKAHRSLRYVIKGSAGGARRDAAAGMGPRARAARWIAVPAIVFVGLLLVSLFAATAAQGHGAVGHRRASAATISLRVRDDTACAGGRTARAGAKPGTAWMYARPNPTAWMYAQRNPAAWMYLLLNRTAWMYAALAHNGARPGSCLAGGGMPA